MSLAIARYTSAGLPDKLIQEVSQDYSSRLAGELTQELEGMILRDFFRNFFKYIFSWVEIDMLGKISSIIAYSGLIHIRNAPGSQLRVKITH
jgi:hypothetical protein